MAALTWMVLGFLLLYFPVATLSIGPPAQVVLPLRTRKVATSSLRQPNKLVFHHNVSLTVTLAVGTPPQNVSMVLDTGSELSWLLCNSTPSASAAAAAAFRPRSSSSYAPIPCSSPTCQSQARDLPSPPYCDDPSTGRGPCRVSLSYADASSSDGALASESFRLGQYPPLRAVFGCMDNAYSSSGDAPPAAGILGFNRGALSFVTQTSTRRFSYCISDRDGTGLLVLGAPAEDGGGAAAAEVKLSYTPMVEVSVPLPYFDRVAYSVQLEGIRVGPTLLPIPKSVLVPDHTGAGQTMVDSGSQFTFLLGPAYESLKREFLRQTRGLLAPVTDPDFVFQGAFDTCFVVPTGNRSTLPAVALMFRGGAEVVVGGERLLYRAAPGRDRWCLTFGNSDLVPMEAYVIGHHHQQNLWVEYDLDLGRVGFAPVRCDLVSQRLGVTL